MGVQNPNSTDYVHSDEPNLLNIHKVMQYRNDGTPELRVNSTFEGNIVISGNVNIPGVVEVESSHDHPVHTHTDELGNIDLSNTWMPVQGNVVVSGGNITVQQGTTPWVTTGNANVTVTGNIGGITTLPAITGNVNVNNFPANVSITQMPAVTGNVTVTQGTSPWQVQGNVTISQVAGEPTLVKYINTPENLQMDMTQRLRVANPTQSWWYAPTVDKDGDLRYIESFTGTGAGSIFVQNLSSISIGSGTDANGSAIRISRRRHKMRPGISMLASFSINWNGYDSGIVTKRAGLFTNYNGIFYEVTTDLAVVIRRRLADGTLVEKRIMRSDFNIDKLDGTGLTGLNLSPVVINQATITAYVSKTQIAIPGDGNVWNVVYAVSDLSQFTVSQKFAVTGVSPTTYNGTVMVSAVSGTSGAGNITVTYITDPGVFSSLSSATMKHNALHHQYVFGFDFGGSRATRIRFFIEGPEGRNAIHVEDFSGELSSPFSNAPAVSTRYEVINASAPTFRPSFLVSSEVVNVEAELELSPGFGVATNNTPVVYPKGGTATHPVLGIALRAGEPYQRSDLQLQAVTFADLANINQQNSGVFYWRLVFNPTIGGTVPASVDVGKATRYWAYTAATTVTGGIDLISGYASSTQQFDVRTALNFLNLGSNIEYTDSDKIVLVVQQLVGGTSDARLVATINFIESL